MQNMITLQLSVPALQHLMDGDPAFVLSLKQAVIQEFVKRLSHVKVDDALKAEIENAISRQIGTFQYGRGGTLSTDLLEKVRATAIEVVSKIQQDATTAARQFATEEVHRNLQTLDSTEKNRV